MIPQFVQLWELRKSELEDHFAQQHPQDYKEIVVAVVSLLAGSSPAPDPKRVHEIDDGNYQGTLVYVIAEIGYQPQSYWYVRVSYGSCAVCDTLEDIRSQNYKAKPTVRQVADYMTLALHIVQGLHPMEPSGFLGDVG